MVGWQTPLISSLFLLWLLNPPALSILQLLSIMGACFTSTFLSVPLYWTILYPHCQCMTSVVVVVIDIYFVVYLSWYPLIIYNNYYYMIEMFLFNKRSTSWKINSCPFRGIDENKPDMAKCRCIKVLLFKLGWWRNTTRFGSPGGKIFLVAATVRWALD